MFLAYLIFFIFGVLKKRRKEHELCTGTQASSLPLSEGLQEHWPDMAHWASLISTQPPHLPYMCYLGLETAFS